MIELVWDQPFIRLLKKWQKRHPDLVETFRKKLSLFTQDRLVFEFLAENRVLLIDIGTHDEVYYRYKY